MNNKKFDKYLRSTITEYYDSIPEPNELQELRIWNKIATTNKKNRFKSRIKAISSICALLLICILLCTYYLANNSYRLKENTTMNDSLNSSNSTQQEIYFDLDSINYGNTGMLSIPALSDFKIKFSNKTDNNHRIQYVKKNEMVQVVMTNQPYSLLLKQNGLQDIELNPKQGFGVYNTRNASSKLLIRLEENLSCFIITSNIDKKNLIEIIESISA